MVPGGGGFLDVSCPRCGGREVVAVLVDSRVDGGLRYLCIRCELSFDPFSMTYCYLPFNGKSRSSNQLGFSFVERRLSTTWFEMSILRALPPHSLFKQGAAIY